MIIALIIFLLVAPFIVAIIWNGLHGKGYKFTYKAPPINTKNGKLVRILAGVYLAALVFLLFANIYTDHAVGERYKGGMSRILFVIVFIVVTAVFSHLVELNRNK